MLSFVTGIGIFSTIYLTPLFLGYVRGFSAWQTGVAIFSTGAASLVGVPVYILLGAQVRHALADDVRARPVRPVDVELQLHHPRVGRRPSCWCRRSCAASRRCSRSRRRSTLGLGSLPPERLKYASGLFNMMRNLGGAVGIAVCGAILNARTNFHFNAIASHLTPANARWTRLLAGLAQRYAALPGSLDAGHVAALKQLWQLAYREASTLAYADAFRAIMIAFIAATLLVPLLRNVMPPKVAAADAH